jgi:hypothetical protein
MAQLLFEIQDVTSMEKGRAACHPISDGVKDLGNR